MTPNKTKQRSPQESRTAPVVGESVLDPDFDNMLVEQADAEWSRWRWPPERSDDS